MQNLRERAVSGQIFFRQNNGLALPDYPFTIAPQASLVLDTGKLPQIGQMFDSGFPIGTSYNEADRMGAWLRTR